MKYLAKHMADVIGHGMSEKCERQAEIAEEFFSDRIEQIEKKNAELLKLLDIAACPCCDKSGSYYDGQGEVNQCQWCDEVKQLREQSE